MTDSWQSYLAERFPGYLLPESARTRLSVDEARRFLAALTGRADSLSVLRAASLLAPHVQEVVQLVTRDLLELVRVLPSRTETETRRWQGGFRGKLHLPQTLALHLAGERASFVTQSRVRTFDTAENILVRAVCTRLLHVLRLLREARVLPSGGWGPGLRDCEGTLAHLLASTALRNVSAQPITHVELRAARDARLVGYRHCAEWWERMHGALDDDTPEAVARTVAEGALLPLAESTRFELAVVVRLAEQLAARTADTHRLERGLIVAGREDMVALVSDTGVNLRLYYNQSFLPSGRVEQSARHYLPNTGRQRPDLTLVYERDGKVVDAVVFECKLSDNPSYLLQGFYEATVYRHEYAAWLGGWPLAVLVTSSSIAGELRREDEVVAVGWDAWPPRALVDTLVERLRGGQ